jgi:hypothetical protein
MRCLFFIQRNLIFRQPYKTAGSDIGFTLLHGLALSGVMTLSPNCWVVTLIQTHKDPDIAAFRSIMLDIVDQLENIEFPGMR